MTDKNVLVLFYDRKDREREIQYEGRSTTLEEEIKRGFEGTGVNYNIRTASPSHEKWMVRSYMNEQKYDGMVVVAGLSCSLDVPHDIMEDLYENQMIHISSRDWNRNEAVTSNYFKQERPVPIIGVPTKDPLSDGEFAFWAMHMISRPRDAACVGVEEGYKAAKLISKVLTNEWNDVHIIVPSMVDNSPPYEIAKSLVKHLNSAFQPYDDCRVEFGIHPASNYGNRPFGDERTLAKNILPVCVYEDVGELEQLNGVADCVVGVFSPKGKDEFKKYISTVSQRKSLEHVIHVRPGIGENAAVFVAQCLSMHPYKKTVTDKETGKKEEVDVWLKPSRFKELRKMKSQKNVEEYDVLRKKK